MAGLGGGEVDYGEFGFGSAAECGAGWVRDCGAVVVGCCGGDACFVMDVEPGRCAVTS